MSSTASSAKNNNNLGYLALTAEERLKELERIILSGNKKLGGDTISIETFIDLFTTLYDEVTVSSLRREKRFQKFIEWSKPYVSKIKDLQLKISDFDILNVIGRGAFGEVALARMKKNPKRVFAIKVMHKWQVIYKAETACFREERDILVHGNPDWITKMYYSFHDDKSLYFVMDYYAGGDLLTLLARHEYKIPESTVKFYAAEIIMAIDSIHQLGYVHRDIKPDNILIDKYGHIRLGDFGSCLKMDRNGYVTSKVAVGTPDYISPEILRGMEDNRGRYGQECDWWSLGICIYEMFCGDTAFYSESLIETYSKIMNHEKHLMFPPDLDDKEEAVSLLKGLITDRENRLGKSGIQEFKSHVFFKEVDWENLKKTTPPKEGIPQIKDDIDTTYFDADGEGITAPDSLGAPSGSGTTPFTGHHLPFIGFTYSENLKLADNQNITSDNSTELYEQINYLKDSLSKAASGSKPEEDIIRKNEIELNQLKASVKEKEFELEQIIRLSKEIEEELSETKSKLNELKVESSNHILEIDTKDSEIKHLDGDLQMVTVKNRELERKLDDMTIELERISLEKEQLTAKQKDTPDRTEKVKNLELQLLKSQKESKDQILGLKDEINDLKTVDSSKDRQILLMTDKLQTAKQQYDRDANEKIREANIKFEREKNLLVKQLEASAKQKVLHQQERNQLLTDLENFKKEASTIPDLRTDLDAKEKCILEQQTLLEEHKNEIKKLESEVGNFDTTFGTGVGSISNAENSILATPPANNPLQSNDSWLTIRRQKHMGQALKEMQAKLDVECQEKMSAQRTVQDYQLKTDHLEGEVVRLTETVSLKDAQITQLSEQIIEMKKDYESMSAQIQQNIINQQQQANFQQQQPQANQAINNYDEVHLQNNNTQLPEGQNDVENWLNQHYPGAGIAHNTTGSSLSGTPVQQRHNNSQPQLDESNSSNVQKLQLEYLRRMEISRRENAANRSQSNLQPPAGHEFKVKTFHNPKTCDVCGAVMLGIRRQGAICESCKFVAHVPCAKDALNICPIPDDARMQMNNYNQKVCKGMAYNGFVKIPKPRGVKSGWKQMFMYLSDFKVEGFYPVYVICLESHLDTYVHIKKPAPLRLYLYEAGDLTPESVQSEVYQLIDIRDPNFKITDVTHNDVIHANKKEIPLIFRITSTIVHQPNAKLSMLFMAENKIKKQEWIKNVSKLMDLLASPEHQGNVALPLELMEAYDSTLPTPNLSKGVNTGMVYTFQDPVSAESEKILLGTEDGLFAVDTMKDEIVQVSDSVKGFCGLVKSQIYVAYLLMYGQKYQPSLSRVQYTPSLL